MLPFPSAGAQAASHKIIARIKKITLVFDITFLHWLLFIANWLLHKTALLLAYGRPFLLLWRTKVYTYNVGQDCKLDLQ
jgi:hypothetical protein